MADVQFPTNNFDAAHGGKQPDNTPNTDAIASNNYGRARTAPTLYSDERYLDGDGLLYGLGMTAQRVLSFPKDSNDGITGHKGNKKGLGNGLMWHDLGKTIDGGQYLELKVDSQWLSFNGTASDELTLNIPTLALSIVGDTDFLDTVYPLYRNGDTTTPTKIGINIGKGLYTGSSSSVTDTYHMLNINLYHNIYNQTTQNLSGLEFDTGVKTDDVLGTGVGNAQNQLKIKFDSLESGQSKLNRSGLQILPPREVGSDSYTGGLCIRTGDALSIDSSNNLNVLYDGITVKKNNNDQLYVDTSATDTWRPIKIKHGSNNPILVVGEATSTGDIVFFDGEGINVDSGTNSIWFDLQQATANVLGGIKAVGLEGQISSNYDTAVDGIAIDISNGNNRGKLHLKLAKDNACGVAKLYTSLDGSGDNNTDGSVTQLAIHNAYASLSERIDDLEDLELEFKIAASLPTASESQKHYIYLIPISGASAPDAYAEYVCVNKGTSANPNWAWEKIGDTNIDLSGYIQFTDLPDLTLTATEVAAIVSDVFGF